MISPWIALLLVCGTLAERISPTPDVSWNSRGSSSGSRSPSFSSSSDSDSRFPITGGGSGSRGSSFSDNTRNSARDSSRFSGNSRDSSRFSDSDSNFGSSSSKTSGDINYVQIIASLVRLGNTKGLINTGSSCASFGGKCDPIVYANLDTERPNAAWPGAKEVKFWPVLVTAKKSNDLDIGIANITKRYCGQAYKEANLRVRVEDKKALTSNALINEFDCPINREPARDQMSATWSPEAQCIARFPKGGQTLTYKYKVFFVNKIGCDATTPGPTTTKGSFFG